MSFDEGDTMMEITAATSRTDRLSVVLCGSFRRGQPALADIHEVLTANFDLLSPAEIAWVDPHADFVRSRSELGRSVIDVEGAHLAAIQRADFVWLHAPDGYVGMSGAMEVGFARAGGIPVYTSDAVDDVTVREMVTQVASPLEVPHALVAVPGAGLAALQSYYDRIAKRRGWDGESARDTLLLLTEELGELAREVRVVSGLARNSGDSGSSLGLELADVQLYLIHLANVLNINLDAAVTAKERINAERHLRSSAA